jgi:hypothetical protein
MTELFFLLSISVSGVCGLVLWVHPRYDDCFVGRIGLLGSIAAATIVTRSLMEGYSYSNVQPEVALALASQALYCLWTTYRFLIFDWKDRPKRHRTLYHY